MYNPRLGLLGHVATLLLVFWGTFILSREAFYEEWLIQGAEKRPHLIMTTFMICHQPHLAGLLQETQPRATSNWPFPRLWSCHYAHFTQGPLATRQSMSQPDTTADSRHHQPVVGPQLRGTPQLCISNRPSASPTPDQGAQASVDPQSNKKQFLGFSLVSFYGESWEPEGREPISSRPASLDQGCRNTENMGKLNEPRDFPSHTQQPSDPA